jgi:uncharacterized membrane protein (DUF2068 family)
MSSGDRPSRTPISHRQARHSLGLRIIAVYKAIKSACLIVVAFVAFGLHKEKNFDDLLYALEHLSLADTDGLRWKLVLLLEQMGPGKFVAIGSVALGYATIFATEGTGLWLRKHWAEWFTVIATGSLVPFEIYEMFHKFSSLKLAALLANVAIVVYLARLATQPRGIASGRA